MRAQFISRPLEIISQHPLWASLAGGMLCALALPPWHAVPLFFVGFSLLLLCLHNIKTNKKAFLSGFLFGFSYFTIGLYWISNAILVHIDEFWWAYPFALFGLPLYLALYYGLACYIAVRITLPQSWQRYIALIAFITLADFMRGFMLTGFPWNTPGMIWISIMPIAQLASIGGLEGLSALTFLWAGLLFAVPVFYRQHKRLTVCYTAILCLIFVAGLGYGMARLQNEQPANNSTLPIHRIIVVQPNIPQIEKWEAQYLARNFKRHIALSLEALQNVSATDHARSTIIIWPETAISYYLMENQNVRQALAELRDYNPASLNSTHETYLVTGLLDRIENSESAPDFTNSIIVMNGSETVGRYDKHHLVPFGEYMPYQDILGWMPLVQIGGFKQGQPPAPMALTNDLLLLPLICYEIIFPRHSFAVQDADFIVNVTNDAWYGDSAGPVQHLVLAQFRAIEQGKLTYRAANTGISAAIDGYGQVIESLSYGAQGYIRHNYNKGIKVNTLYQKYNYLMLIIYFSIIFAFFYILKMTRK